MVGMAGLDTQNQAWASDRTKFGYRMLEKMGWKEGKGLGAGEDGRTDHVRARKKLGVSGIGVNDRETAWDVPGKVATGLNDVLSRLQPISVAQNEPKAEEKRTTKRARGYYERRRAGKTVGNYSKQALAEIFGGAAPNADQEDRSVDVEQESESEDWERTKRDIAKSAVYDGKVMKNLAGKTNEEEDRLRKRAAKAKSTAELEEKQRANKMKQNLEGEENIKKKKKKNKDKQKDVRNLRAKAADDDVAIIDALRRSSEEGEDARGSGTHQLLAKVEEEAQDLDVLHCAPEEPSSCEEEMSTEVKWRKGVAVVDAELDGTLKAKQKEIKLMRNREREERREERKLRKMQKQAKRERKQKKLAVVGGIKKSKKTARNMKLKSK